MCPIASVPRAAAAAPAQSGQRTVRPSRLGWARVRVKGRVGVRVRMRVRVRDRGRARGRVELG